MCNRLVPSKTPPPKHSRLEKKLPCLGLPSLFLNHFPNFIGINPRNIETPPKRTITLILLATQQWTSIVMEYYRFRFVFSLQFYVLCYYNFDLILASNLFIDLMTYTMKKFFLVTTSINSHFQFHKVALVNYSNENFKTTNQIHQIFMNYYEKCYHQESIWDSFKISFSLAYWCNVLKADSSHIWHDEIVLSFTFFFLKNVVSASL